MSQLWIEKLRSAETKGQFEDTLLRDFRSLPSPTTTQEWRAFTDVKEQITALAALAFPAESTVL